MAICNPAQSGRCKWQLSWPPLGKLGPEWAFSLWGWHELGSLQDICPVTRSAC